MLRNLLAGATTIAAIWFVLGHATAAAEAEKKPPVPAGAKISIELNRREYFLGENVLLHFCIENVGDAPFQIESGGDYRGASRALRFSVEARDEAGKLCEDPDPSGMCFGGLGGGTTVEPGQKRYETVPLLRYRIIDKPGTYRIRATHDLGWTETPERPCPVAETTITFVRPTADEARQLIEAMASAPKRDSRFMFDVRKGGNYPDFYTLRDPVYLAPLKKLATRDFQNAVAGIDGIAGHEATEALLELADDKDPKFALEAARALRRRLPAPTTTPQIDLDLDLSWKKAVELHQRFIERSWDGRFTERTVRLARGLIEADEVDRLQCGAEILACVGAKDDLPHLLRVLDRRIEATMQPPTPDVYPRPRDLCRQLLNTAVALSSDVDVDALDSLGGSALFLETYSAKTAERRDATEERFVALMGHAIPFVRELALQRVADNAGAAILKRLPSLIADEDEGVQVAACNAAERTRNSPCKEALLEQLAKTSDNDVFDAAFSAAGVCNAQAERLDATVARIADLKMTARCLRHLAPTLFENINGWSGPSNDWTEVDAQACHARWITFMNKHGDALRVGKRFIHGDPALTADLFPTMEIHAGPLPTLDVLP